jgi:glucose-1-phosphate adenylyltransferase
MDFRKLVEQHNRSGADVTVATIPVRRDPARDFGIMHINADKRITRFVEKPKEDAVLDTLKIQDPLLSTLNVNTSDDLFLASMGIYVFSRKILTQSLAGTEPDFGKHIIPTLIETKNVFAYVYQGYWEDIGTISAFYDANLALTDPLPPFDFYNTAAPIYTHARYLPASKVQRSQIEHAILAEGCIIEDSKIIHSLIGIRSRIEAGTTVKDSIIMGLDYYETDHQVGVAESKGLPPLGIGPNTFIERTIVDKNARIGANVRITPEGKPATFDGPNFYIRDGIVLIPKGGVVPDNTVI